jgi:hypothetical protein
MKRTVIVVVALLGGLCMALPVSAASSAGPKVGDHWHMAFGVWNCGSWEPSLAPGDDPLGIHTHGDGLIHVHPFTEEAAGAKATLGVFFDVEKVSVNAKAVTLPGKTLRAGDLCDGSKATIRTLIWPSKKAPAPAVVSGDPAKLGLRDEEIVVIAYGPANAKIGLPPSAAELDDPADLPPPPLTAAQLKVLPPPPKLVPLVVTKGAPSSTLKLTDRVVGTGDEAKNGSRPYVRFVLYLWRTGEKLDSSSWEAGPQPLALSRIGKGRLLPGIEKGVVGMKVGGIREIVIPPVDGFGADGSPPVLGTDTMVMVMQLVAVAK